MFTRHRENCNAPKRQPLTLEHLNLTTYIDYNPAIQELKPATLFLDVFALTPLPIEEEISLT